MTKRAIRAMGVCILLLAMALVLAVAFAGVYGGQAAAGQPAPSRLSGIGQLTGIVRDADGPVAGAVVRVQLTKNQTTTDANGSFMLSDIAATDVFTVTAWAPGYYVGWITATLATQPVTITLKPHYTTDNVEYDWFSFGGIEGSASCAPCHTQYPEWAADAHAQAAVNPRFLSMYTGTDIMGRKGPLTQLDASGKLVPPPSDQPNYGPGWRLDYPNRAGNCAACHTPLAAKIPNTQNCGWSGCHTDVTTEWSQGIIAPAPLPQGLSGDAAEGVACDFCHKIGDVYLDPQTRLPYPDMPGILSYRLYRPSEGQQLFFGTFDDVTRRVTYLPLEEESAFCAPCHYGVFGGVVGVGSVKDGIVIYNSYGEWLESPYSDPETGKTCQDCHMPPVDYEYIVYPERGGLPRDPNRIHNHRMPGAADANLLQNSVTMTTTARWEGNTVLVEVQITNDKTGHHVPTDVPLRHLILVIEATDADGRRMMLVNGPVLPNWAGNYAGLPGKIFAKVLQDEWTGEIPAAAYWRPVRLVEDTRIAAFATDVSRYIFQVAEARPVTIEARLIFRRAYQELMKQKGWTDPDILMEQSRITVLPALSGR